MTSLYSTLRNSWRGVEVSKKAALDSANTPTQPTGVTIDSIASHEISLISQAAVAAVQQWIETGDDLDAGESLSDRLFALVVGIADSNKDGEISEDEEVVISQALDAVWDYLESLGVEESDVSALLNDWDDEVANRVFDLVASALPDGADAADAAIDSFVFGDGQEATFDATYINKFAIRGGQKVRIKKRISGTVRLTAKQKIAIKKMQNKSHSATARARRIKSMKISKRAGL